MLTHGQSKSPLYKRWKSMRARCYYPGNSSYRYYGAKGIGVDPAWATFEAFAEWALGTGFQPDLELDRIDPGRYYGPANCRWATKRENTKRARLLPVDLDERLAAYAAEQGKSRSTVIEEVLEAFLPKLGEEVTYE